MNHNNARRDFLTLWKWEEALEVHGRVVTRGRGKHSGGLNPGDRMFIWAVTGEELYILGAIRVKRGGKDWAEGPSVYGPFMIVPLKRLKWRMRFQNTKAARLTSDNLAMQVRARRQPTAKTVELLEKLLSDSASRVQDREEVASYHEAEQKEVMLTRRERNRKLRSHVLALRGHLCEICQFDFVERYGEFAKHCVEIHHLNPIAAARRLGREAVPDEVIVVCPNCHRALHQSDHPEDWKRFRRACKLG
jgi:predicted HNH restriction endonuclease